MLYKYGAILLRKYPYLYIVPILTSIRKESANLAEKEAGGDGFELKHEWHLDR